MRYFEIREELSPAERAQRDSAKRLAANKKLDAARRKKSNAARVQQDANRTANDAMQCASNTLANIKPS